MMHKVLTRSEQLDNEISYREWIFGGSATNANDRVNKLSFIKLCLSNNEWLTEKQKLALKKYVIEGKTLVEVGKEMGIHMTTVRWHIVYAIKKIRKLYVEGVNYVEISRKTQQK